MENKKITYIERKTQFIENLAWCKDMVESIICYHWKKGKTENDFINDKYLASYVKELGKEVVLQALKDCIEHIDTITYDAITDSEGCSYNSITFKDGYLRAKDMKDALYELWDNALNVNK